MPLGPGNENGKLLRGQSFGCTNRGFTVYFLKRGKYGGPGGGDGMEGVGRAVLAY